METVTVALLIVVVAAVQYLLSYRSRRYWQCRGVPQVVGPWPVGSFGPVLLYSKHFADVYQDIYRRFDGHAYCGFYKLWTPTLLVRDPALVRKVLLKDFDYFRDNEPHVPDERDALGGRNPFFGRGERWRTARRQLVPAFTTGRIQDMIPVMVEVSRDLCAVLEASQEVPGRLEAKELAARYTTDICSWCAFGTPGNSLRDPDAEFRRAGRRLLYPTPWNSFKILSIIVLPQLADLLSLRRMERSLTAYFERAVKEAVSLRDESGTPRPDFLQFLVDSWKGGDLSDQDLTAHVVTFFANGIESSSVSLAFTLLELGRRPDVQGRLATEVTTVLAAHGGRISAETLRDMPYLDAVVSESLRLYPPITAMAKVTTRPYQLPGGGHLDVGTSVVIPILALHRDPQLFPDPENFDPKRFFVDTRASIPRGAYVPFGDGPRSCFGSRFAVAQMKVALAAIVSDFEVSVNARTVIPVRLDPVYNMLSAQGGIWIDFKHRTHPAVLTVS